MFSAFYRASHQEAPLSLESSQLPLESSLADREEAVAVSGNKSIGIMGDAITPVYQQHFHLPEGLFITHVEEGSVARKQDIREGDVLLSLDGCPITDEQSLKSFLEQKDPAEPCTARIYRLEEEKQLTVQLKIEEIG
jgi:S1-C subfamily serine protease